MRHTRHGIPDVSHAENPAVWPLSIPTKCHLIICETQEKETATKTASDAAATPQQHVGGELPISTSGTSPAQVSVATGAGADLDDYIKNLLSMPAPVGSTEDQTGATPPDPGDFFSSPIYCPIGVACTDGCDTHVTVSMNWTYDRF